MFAHIPAPLAPALPRLMLTGPDVDPPDPVKSSTGVGVVALEVVTSGAPPGEDGEVPQRTERMTSQTMLTNLSDAYFM